MNQLKLMDMDQMVNDYAMLKEKKRVIEQEMEELKYSILQGMSDLKLRKVVYGEYECSKRSYVQNKIDTKLLKEREPEIAAAYTYAIPITQLVVKHVDGKQDA